MTEPFGLEDEYPGEIRAMIRAIKEDRDRARSLYPNADVMAEAMRPDSAHNHAILDLLATPEAAYLRIKPEQLTSALRTKRARLEREAAQIAREAKQAADKAAKAKQQAEREAKQAADKAAKEADKAAKEEAKRKAREERRAETIDVLNEELGGVPTDEREYVGLLWHKRIKRMTFDRQFFDHDDKPLKAEQVALDMQLTAASLNLVKPRGDLLAQSNIDRALTEKVIEERERCVMQVCARVMDLPNNVEREVVMAAFECLCGWYFKEPLFASATVRKMIWQIKRMLLDLPVEQRHMMVFVGQQNTGKSFVQRMIAKVIADITAEASMKDVLDERQMELPGYGLILLDELVSADRADSAALKNFITGVDWARRPMRTNVIEKIRLRATLWGTTNHSLGKLIFDSSGMRRFVELEVLPRSEIEPFWPQIIGFNWEHLWQAVDIGEEDPLMREFADVLIEKQEALRTADNTELWAQQFEPTRYDAKYTTAEYVEYFAGDLYGKFREFEERYDRGWRGTSLTRWGRELKSLIDSGRLAGWSYYKYGPKLVYRIVEAEHKQTTDNIVRPPKWGGR